MKAVSPERKVPLFLVLNPILKVVSAMGLAPISCAGKVLIDSVPDQYCSLNTTETSQKSCITAERTQKDAELTQFYFRQLRINWNI
jgi:uncharacterized protein YecT (DUF1311 family)